MRIFKKNGVCIQSDTTLYVDSNNPKDDLNIVTHGHSDHARFRKNSNCLMTKETKDLIKEKTKEAKIKTLAYNRKFKKDDFELTFHSAGHILGSSQIFLANGATATITSDFKLQDSLLFKGAKVIPSDTLVIESTYGRPEYVFPDREKVYEEISGWIKNSVKEKNFVVLGAYSTGKAQELTKLVNEYTKEIPLVYDLIYRQNKIYEKHGVNLGNYLELNNNLNEGNVLIMPPHLINNGLLPALGTMIKKNISVAIASGWRSSKFGSKGFPLSDHADFNQLLQYVEEAKPKQVFTFHGFDKELAYAIRRKLGINARPLSSYKQRVLFEY